MLCFFWADSARQVPGLHNLTWRGWGPVAPGGHLLPGKMWRALPLTGQGQG